MNVYQIQPLAAAEGEHMFCIYISDQNDQASSIVPAIKPWDQCRNWARISDLSNNYYKEPTNINTWEK